MCSAWDTDCSQSVGSPIRTSPDHSVLTAPRSFSQLATSFFAFLCLGILTHALSSLTIKFPVAPAPFRAATASALAPRPGYPLARSPPLDGFDFLEIFFPDSHRTSFSNSQNAPSASCAPPQVRLPAPGPEPAKRETHLQFFLPIILFNCQRSLPLHPQGVSSFGMPYAGKGTLSPPTGRKPSSTGTASLALRIESFSFRSSAESYLVWWA